MYRNSIIKSRLSILVCASTQKLGAILAKTSTEGLLIQSEYQSQGQGQQNRNWQAAPGENLLFSILLRPRFLAPRHLFWLNMAAALSLYDLLKPLSLPQLCIKWPNDLYVAQKKIAGILIKSKVQGSKLRYVCLGVGLNVNQKQFTVPEASSLALFLGTEVKREPLLKAWEHCFSARYATLRSPAPRESLRKDYQKYLFAKGETQRYQGTTGPPFSATLLGTDIYGRLQLHTPAGKQYFWPGTLHFLGHDPKKA